MSKASKTIMKLLLNLLPFVCSVSIVAQTPISESVEVIREGVQIITCFPDSVTYDTLSIEQFMEQREVPKGSSIKEMEESNKMLRQYNEKMKEPE